MRRTLIGILSLLFSSCLFAVPASAVNLPQCGPNVDGTDDFTLVGQDKIVFEGGNPFGGTINGNVLVTGPNGFVKLGPHVTINGTVTAHKITLASNGTSQITNCVADIIEGPGCLATSGTFAAFVLAHGACVAPANFASLCLQPAPAVNACVNGKPPVTISTVFVNPLAPGCYGALTIDSGAVLKLLPDPSSYTFKSIRMKAGARLESNLVGSFATVNVNGEFITEPGAQITDIHLNGAYVLTAQIFNNSILTRVIFNEPFGTVHLHTGTQLVCSEVCGKVLDVEPITATCDVITGICACEPGFEFEDQSPGPKPERVCVPIIRP
jgi:hypothetical protein